jgi:hypothetical protein
MGTPENRELAFRVYAAMGGRDIPRVLDRLKSDYGLSISAQTLYRWRSEGGWELRMTGRDSEEPSAFELRLFNRLMRLIERYEADLDRRPNVGSQEAFAYANLARAAIELSKRLPPEAKDPEEMRRVALEILETDYGIKREDR